MRYAWMVLIIAIAGLALILLATICYAAGIRSYDTYLNLLLAGTVVWFAGIIAYRRLVRQKNQ
jgi:predicted membrane channel-forming protein YqfA (hemolysin III family)